MLEEWNAEIRALEQRQYELKQRVSRLDESVAELSELQTRLAAVRDAQQSAAAHQARALEASAFRSSKASRQLMERLHERVSGGVSRSAGLERSADETAALLRRTEAERGGVLAELRAVEQQFIAARSALAAELARQESKGGIDDA